MTATPEPVSPAPDTDRSALVDAVHQALQVDAITAAHVALWGDAPGWVDTTLNEMLENAVLDSVVQRVEPLLAGLRADLDRARAERDTFADLHRGEARTHDETIASLNAARAEVERLGLEIQGYQVDGPYQRGHEHGQQARQAEVDQARAERDALSRMLRGMARRASAWHRLAIDSQCTEMELRGDTLVVGQAVTRWRERFFEMVRERDEARAELARLSGARSMTTPNDLLPLLAGLLADLDRVETERDKLGREVDRLTAAGARPIPDDAAAVEIVAKWLFRVKTDRANMPQLVDRLWPSAVLDDDDREAWRKYARDLLADLGATPTTGPAPAAADAVRVEMADRLYAVWELATAATRDGRGLTGDQASRIEHLTDLRHPLDPGDLA